MATQALALIVGVRYRSGGPKPDTATDGSGIDAREMKDLLLRRGFAESNITLLDTEAATGQAIIDGLEAMAIKAAPGDLVVFYNSSHGGQVPNKNPETDEETDGKDETICAYDRQVIDDELYAAFAKLKPGVRLVFTNDACNSGTTFKFNEALAKRGGPRLSLESREVKVRVSSPFFERVVMHWDLAAELIYLGGATDGRSSGGLPEGGVFTIELASILIGQSFTGSYDAFYQKLKRAIADSQVPTLWVAPNVSAAFRSQTPYSI